MSKRIGGGAINIDCIHSGFLPENDVIAMVLFIMCVFKSIKTLFSCEPALYALFLTSRSGLDRMSEDCLVVVVDRYYRFRNRFFFFG